MSSSSLSPTMQVYLAEVYRMSDHDGDFVSTSALAELLDVSAPAVNRMVNRLKELGLLEHEPYRGISLTAAGRQEACKQIRRHRIAEAFLVKVMGFGWHEVYEEAQSISMALSEPLIQRMSEMAGHPTACPHGEPIPDAEGRLPEPQDTPLDAVPLNVKLAITRVRTREADRLQYLQALGLVPGAQVEVLHIAPFNGPLQLRLKDEYRIIGHNLAELIRAVPVRG